MKVGCDLDENYPMEALLTEESFLIFPLCTIGIDNQTIKFFFLLIIANIYDILVP